MFQTVKPDEWKNYYNSCKLFNADRCRHFSRMRKKHIGKVTMNEGKPDLCSIYRFWQATVVAKNL